MCVVQWPVCYTLIRTSNLLNKGEDKVNAIHKKTINNYPNYIFCELTSEFFTKGLNTHVNTKIQNAIHTLETMSNKYEVKCILKLIWIVYFYLLRFMIILLITSTQVTNVNLLFDNWLYMLWLLYNTKYVNYNSITYCTYMYIKIMLSVICQQRVNQQHLNVK